METVYSNMQEKKNTIYKKLSKQRGTITINKNILYMKLAQDISKFEPECLVLAAMRLFNLLVLYGQFC